MAYKAVIQYKKVKFWCPYYGLLEKIVTGLINNEFKISIELNEPKTAPDLLIKWHCDNEPYLYTTGMQKGGENKYINTIVLMIELGWFDRDNNLLLYDKNRRRINVGFKKNYKDFFKPIINNKKKVWLIMGQMYNDKNLDGCSNYDKWINTVTSQLKNYGKYPVYYRPHPKGDVEPENSLEYDLGRAIGVVSWNSSGVLKAMMHSIPVCIYDFPELENTCKKELTSKWIKEVENDMHRTLHASKLNEMASQQININEFDLINYKGFME